MNSEKNGECLTARVSLASLLAFVLASGVLAQELSDEDLIRQERERFNAAIAAHDIPTIMSFHDSEYQITTSLGDLSHGRDEQDESWQWLIDERADVVYVRTPGTVEVSGSYPLAAESGTWTGTWTSDKGPVRTGGSYAAMWRKGDAGWKVRSELFVALYCEGEGCP